MMNLKIPKLSYAVASFGHASIIQTRAVFPLNTRQSRGQNGRYLTYLREWLIDLISINHFLGYLLIKL